MIFVSREFEDEVERNRVDLTNDMRCCSLLSLRILPRELESIF